MLPVGKTIRWIEKWIILFLMGTTSSITMQSLGKIVRRAPAVGAKMWCLFVFLPAGCRFCREAANCRYCFYSQAKNQVFRPAGATRCTDSGQICRTDGHLGPLGCAKFHLNHPRGVGMRPPNIKNFHFLVNSHPVGATPLTDFQNF